MKDPRPLELLFTPERNTLLPEIIVTILGSFAVYYLLKALS